MRKQQMIWMLALAGVASLGVPPARAVVGLIFVNRGAIGANDGTSWVDAFTSL